tara:strand:- start:3335 stop:3616 length:282 start_codon:yes stop_codon:yes gene_type:complete
LTHINKNPFSSDEDGEKVTEQPTLVRRGIQTYYGVVEDSLDNKTENYLEVCITEDKRVTYAQMALFSRLTQEQREFAWKWSFHFKGLVEGAND